MRNSFVYKFVAEVEESDYFCNLFNVTYTGFIFATDSIKAMRDIESYLLDPGTDIIEIISLKIIPYIQNDFPTTINITGREEKCNDC